MSVTLDSLLNIAKSVSGTAGATVTALVATDVIPIPEAWRGAATAAGVFLTGFSVWLTSNKKLIEDDADKFAAALAKADPALVPVLEWAQSVPDEVEAAPVAL